MRDGHRPFVLVITPAARVLAGDFWHPSCTCTWRGAPRTQLAGAKDDAARHAARRESRQAYCSNVCRFRRRRTDALGRAVAFHVKARVRAWFAGELWRLREQYSRDRAARVLRAACGQCIGCGDPLAAEGVRT